MKSKAEHDDSLLFFLHKRFLQNFWGKYTLYVDFISMPVKRLNIVAPPNANSFFCIGYVGPVQRKLDQTFHGGWLLAILNI